MKFHRILTRAPWFRTVISSGWMWGSLVSIGFYLLLNSLPPETPAMTLLQRYLNAHPVENVETGLFFVGLAIVALKAIHVRRERKAFDAVPLLGPHAPAEDHASAVRHLNHQFDQLRPRYRPTSWGRRLEHLKDFLTGTSSSEGLGDELDYLSNAEMDRLHSNHAVLQTVIWSIPILGFLGTVMGITDSIANLTPEQITTSLQDVTSGLGTAFDTTAIALVFSLVLGFSSLSVKLREERLLGDMDQHCRLEVHRCFGVSTLPGQELSVAQQAAAQELLVRTHEMVNRHTSVWNDAVGAMRTDWQQTMEDQRQELVASVQQGSRQTLEEHNDLLTDSRQMWLDLHDNMNRRLLAEIDSFLDKRRSTEEALVLSIQDFTGRIDRVAEEQATRHAQETERLLSGLQSHMTDWQQRLSEFTEALSSQSSAMLHAGEQLEKIALRKSELAQLQTQLTHNLEAIRGAEAFDETLHNLTAAVHLLTARVRSREAA